MALLALMPCRDGYELKNNDQNLVVLKKDLGGAAHCSEEACPPFCTCSCCSTASCILADLPAHFVVISFHPVYADYSMPAIKKQSIEIWQPPQIV